MPELPSITVYCERLQALAGGQVLERIRLLSPFLLRTAVPPLTDTFGKRVQTVERLGKRIILGLEDELFLVVHLMIAGRLRWKEPAARLSKPMGLAAFDFATGTLIFTEASKKKRAALHVVKGRDALKDFDRGGIEVLTATYDTFRAVMTRDKITRSSGR
jgi:formamidopyrimidine-DNA glycosylase